MPARPSIHSVQVERSTIMHRFTHALTHDCIQAYRSARVGRGGAHSGVNLEHGQRGGHSLDESGAAGNAGEELLDWRASLRIPIPTQNGVHTGGHAESACRAGRCCMLA